MFVGIDVLFSLSDMPNYIKHQFIKLYHRIGYIGYQVNHILRIFSLQPHLRSIKNKNEQENQFRFILSTPLYCETASQICRKFSSNCCCSYFVVYSKQ